MKIHPLSCLTVLLVSTSCRSPAAVPAAAVGERPAARTAAPSSYSPGPGVATSNSVVATVNGRPILRSEVEDLMRASLLDLLRRFSDPDERAAELKKLRAKVLESLIDQELILKEFEPFAATFNAKVEAHADEMIKRQFVEGLFKGNRQKFLQELQESGIGYKKFYEQQKKNVIVEMMRGQFAKVETPYVTEDEKAEWVRKNSEMFRVGGKLKLWSITIPGQADGKTPAQQAALAKEVRTSLVNGADFASQARHYSADSKREAGGSWDWVEKKDLADQFWPIVSKLPTGKISDVVPFQGSFYIFWVEARQAGKMKPQAEVEIEVEKRVQMEKRQKASDAWLKKLRKKATIVYPK